MKRKLRLIVTKIRRQKFEPAEFRFLCPVCSEETETVAADEAAIFFGIDRRKLSELIGRGEIHVFQTAGESIRLCRNSLFEKFQK